MRVISWARLRRSSRCWKGFAGCRRLKSCRSHPARPREGTRTPFRASARQRKQPFGSVSRYCSPTACAPNQPRTQLAELEPDVIVVAAYGKLLPAQVLELPPHGCLNLHPSLLPRHRGPSPVATAILEGDETTGVS